LSILTILSLTIDHFIALKIYCWVCHWISVNI